MRVLVILSLLLQTCTPSPNQDSDYPRIEKLWVNSYKIDCVGEGPRTCFQITNGTPDVDPWQIMYDGIAGFEYKPGKLYHLEVSIDSLPPNEVPEDGSYFDYSLLKIIEEIPDPKLRIIDIWVLDSLIAYDQNLNANGEIPRLEFNLPKKLFLGTDGCNEFNGRIERIDGSKLSLGEYSSTEMACENMELPLLFMEALQNSDSYKVENGHLKVFNENGSMLMKLRKVD